MDGGRYFFKKLNPQEIAINYTPILNITQQGNIFLCVPGMSAEPEG